MSPDHPARRRRSARWRRTALALAGAAVLLGACGFRPLYGTAGSAADGDAAPVHAALATVDVDVIADRQGQQLRAFLMERLNPAGRPADPDYRLEVTLSEGLGGIATAEDDTVTRANLTVSADYTLTDLAISEPVLERRFRSITSFNIQDDLFSSLISRESARERSLRDISERIRTDLALYFQRTP